MRIGIDARLLDESGVGRYIRNLLNQLGKLDHENEYFIFLLKKDFDSLRSLSQYSNFQKVETNIPWYTLKEQTQFPKILNKYNLDLVHFPHFNVPINYKRKYIVTIHDLIHQHFAMQRASTHGRLIYKFKQLGYKFIFSKALKNSDKILTPSEFVKKQLIKEWKVKSEKIVVTPEGVEQDLVNLSKKINQEKTGKILQKFNIQPPFLFYVGNAHPHKNVEGLIEAFLKLRQSYQYIQLVLSGKDHYFWQKIKQKNINSNIIYTGFINDEELAALYKSTVCYVVPSFEEGFGIPLLEAMALGCPIASSNKGSLPEVGGDACEYFDPGDSKDMANAIMRVINDKKLRGRLVANGSRRVRQFSWEKLARQTLDVILAV